MYILILFIITALSNSILCGKDSSCKHSNLDIKMKALTKTLGDKNARWPENKEQKTTFCSVLKKIEELAYFLLSINLNSEMYDASNHAKLFKHKCYHGISKAMMKFTILALEQYSIKLTCKNELEMKRFLKRGKCGNKGKAQVSKCWTDWVKELTMIENSTKIEDKIPLMCCSLYEWKKCSLNVYKSLGSKVCSKSSVDGFDKYMENTIIDPLNVIFHCHEDHWDESKHCSQMSKLTSKGGRRQKSKYKTPFPLLLEISDSVYHYDSD